MARTFSPLRSTLALVLFGLSGAALAAPEDGRAGVNAGGETQLSPVNVGDKRSDAPATAGAKGKGKGKGHAKGKGQSKGQGKRKGHAKARGKGHAMARGKGHHKGSDGGEAQAQGPRKGGAQPSLRGGPQAGQRGGQAQQAPARNGQARPGRGIGERPQASLPGKQGGSQRPELRPHRDGEGGGVVQRPEEVRPDAPRGARPQNPKDEKPAAGARPGAGKPSGPGRDAPDGASPPRKPLVVHRSAMLPQLWTPGYHRTGLKGVSHASPEYWSRGIFVYSPPSGNRDVVVVQHMGQETQVVKQAEAPTRAVDRRRSLALGVLGGSYLSGTPDGQSYGDLGLGLVGRFRATESLGVEFAWTHHDQSLTQWTDRANNPMQLSAQLFAFPWTRVSPYITAGYTWNNRSLAQQWTNETTGQQTETVSKSTLRGPHAGLGLEFAIGKSAALDLDMRYIRWMGQEANDPTSPNALRGTAGLTFYF